MATKKTTSETPEQKAKAAAQSTGWFWPQEAHKVFKCMACGKMKLFKVNKKPA